MRTREFKFGGRGGGGKHRQIKLEKKKSEFDVQARSACLAVATEPLFK